MCYCKHATGPPPPHPASCSPGWGAGETSGEGDGWGAGAGTSGEGDGTSAGEGVGAGLGSKGAGAGATLGEGAGASSAGEGAGATGGSSSMTVVCKGCGAAVVGVAFVDALAGLEQSAWCTRIHDGHAAMRQRAGPCCRQICAVPNKDHAQVQP